MQPRVTKFLGYDLFTNPALGAPLSNKPNGIAILSPKSSATFGDRIRTYRLTHRKTLTDFSVELGVDVKTLRDWEMNNRVPCPTHLRLIKSLMVDKD
jgi:DNA-binding transcriptional regulator YiaG